MVSVEDSSNALGAPSRLRVNGLRQPRGVPTDDLSFSWATGTPQIAYELEVGYGSDPLWTSAQASASNSLAVTYAGPALDKLRRTSWRVRTLGPGGWSAWTYAEFTTGLQSVDAWPARWVWAPESRGVPLFRSTLTVPVKSQEVLLAVVACGFVGCQVNGRPVSDDMLVPAWSDYTERKIAGLLYPYRVTPRYSQRSLFFDIAELCDGAVNEVKIELADGWFRQKVRTIEGQMSYGVPRFSAFAYARRADGTGEAIDFRNWRWRESRIRTSSIFEGEVHQPDRAVSSDSLWHDALYAPSPGGSVRPDLGPHDRAQTMGNANELVALRKDDRRVYDAGEAMSGWFSLNMPDTSQSAVIEVRYADELNECGQLDFDSTGGADQVQRDIFHHDGGSATYAPSYTWHGFRYGEIISSAALDGLGVSTVATHSDLSRSGVFAASDAALMAVDAAFDRAFLANVHAGIPSDCPHRERLGYTGDAHVAAEAAAWHFDTDALLRGYLEELANAQDERTGFVPHTVPFAGGGGGPGWGAASTILPMLHWRMYGDSALLRRYLPVMEAYVRYLVGCTTGPNGSLVVEHEEPGGWFLGDWAWPAGSLGANLDPRLVSTYFLGVCARDVARAHKVLGNRDEQARYVKLGERIRADLSSEFFTKATMSYGGNVGGANAFALDLGISSETDAQGVASALVERYRESPRFDTGIFGTPIVLEQLAKAGQTKLAISLITGPGYPSFGYMIESGATTLWENWDGSESHNHPMFGSVSAWFVHRVAGMRAMKGACALDRVLLDPFAQGVTGSASFEYQGARGKYYLGWDADESRRCLTVSIPQGAQASLVAGNGTVRVALPAGDYDLAWDARRDGNHLPTSLAKQYGWVVSA